MIQVILRKEYVDLNFCGRRVPLLMSVILRKEYVDLNCITLADSVVCAVILRKEYVDLNWKRLDAKLLMQGTSYSVRSMWI